MAIGLYVALLACPCPAHPYLSAGPTGTQVWLEVDGSQGDHQDAREAARWQAGAHRKATRHLRTTRGLALVALRRAPSPLLSIFIFCDASGGYIGCILHCRCCIVNVASLFCVACMVVSMSAPWLVLAQELGYRA